MVKSTVLYTVSCLALAMVFSIHAPKADAAASSVKEAPATSTGRAVRFVVPFTPGGGTDVIARAMSVKLGEELGKQVVIDNRPGGGITIGSELVATAPPDGNTILIVTIAHAVNPSLYRNLPYDTEKDFSPISMAVAGAMVLVVNLNVPAKSVTELIALAKANPGRFNYATPGNGSPAHLSGEMFKSMAGIDITHIPYKGAAPATTDVIGGQVQITFSAMGVAPQFVKAGKLRALGVTTTYRARSLPDVPTIAEAGLPGYEVVSWQGILGPGRMPKRILDSMNRAVVNALKDPKVTDVLGSQGYDVTVSTPEEFDRFIRSEIKRYAKLVKTMGTRPE